MRISVELSICADHGQCAIAAPAIFRMDDEGHLIFDEHPVDALRSDAEDATDACPEQAITIID